MKPKQILTEGLPYEQKWFAVLYLIDMDVQNINLLLEERATKVGFAICQNFFLVCGN